LHSEILAIMAATCIAFSSLLISELRGRVGVLRLARWQMVLAFVMTAAVSVALGGWRTLEAWQVGMLAASSAAGIVIASTTYFAAIYAAGPRVTALLFSLGKSLIGLYLGRSGTASGFGAAGSLILVIVWTYYSAQVFLLGAEFTHVYAHARGTRSGDPGTGTHEATVNAVQRLKSSRDALASAMTRK